MRLSDGERSTCGWTGFQCQLRRWTTLARLVCLRRKSNCHRRKPRTKLWLPFDDRLSLIDWIVAAYEDSTLSPPGSPPVSPGRQFSQPILGGSITASPPAASASQDLPTSFKEAMLYDWSRDSALAAIQAASKSASLSGSRNGTTGTGRGRLGLNGALTNGNNHKADSLFQSSADIRPLSQPAQEGGRLLAPFPSKVRKTSVRSAMNGQANGGDEFVTSISHLKMVLSGEVEAPPLTAGVRDGSSSDESMVSYDPSNSDVSFNPPPPSTAYSPRWLRGLTTWHRTLALHVPRAQGAPTVRHSVRSTPTRHPNRIPSSRRMTRSTCRPYPRCPPVWWGPHRRHRSHRVIMPRAPPGSNSSPGAALKQFKPAQHQEPRRVVDLE